MKLSKLFGVMLLATLTACGRQEPPTPVTAPKEAPAMPVLKSESAPPAAASIPVTPPQTASQLGAKSAPTANPTSMTSAEIAAHLAETSTREVVDVNIAMLQEVVESYNRDTKRKPKDLQQLVAEHYLTAVPPAPKGKRYVIDQATLSVKSVNQ